MLLLEQLDSYVNDRIARVSHPSKLTIKLVNFVREIIQELHEDPPGRFIIHRPLKDYDVCSVWGYRFSLRLNPTIITGLRITKLLLC